MLKKLEAQLVLDEKAVLGEGPSWDEKENRLFWVDIQSDKVHIFTPQTGKNNTIKLKKSVGAVVPRKKRRSSTGSGRWLCFP